MVYLEIIAPLHKILRKMMSWYTGMVLHMEHDGKMWLAAHSSAARFKDIQSY